ncbi:hypothetical protein NQ317_008652 [Molorchus minor]|uniref:Tetratricopeptide repeat protein 36 n=1 Tax=Molorchus minor TaxID=1323400 RepID=A0ABQ9K029_9CUCU|nr:hypothetical protein NQ317_008652 [Molorchus minor]
MAQLSYHDRAILNCIFNPNLPLEEASVLQPTEELKRQKSLEIKAIRLTEEGKIEDALNIVNKAIEIAPHKPSLYNNRANIYQFLRKFEVTIGSFFSEALQDTSKAIELSTEKHRKTLCQAHCQRGLLYRRKNELELARADFEVSANMGNNFAKGQLVELNPYAALCNQMLRQVTDALK